MSKSFHPTGEDKDIDDALEDLRYDLDQLREMEHTTEWPVVVEEIEEEQDMEVEPEDTAHKLANPVAVAAFIPVSLAEQKVALRPKDKQPAIPLSEKMDIPPMSVDDDDDDKGLLYLPGVASDVGENKSSLLKEDGDDDKESLQLSSKVSENNSSPEVYRISLVLRTSTY